MFKFIIKRLFAGIFVLIGVVLIIFMLLNVIPVDSGRMTLGANANAETLAAVNKELHLNYSSPKRLVFYFNDISPISFHTKINIESPFYLNENKYNYVPIVTIKEKVLVIKTPYFGRSFQNKQLVSDLLINKIAQTALLAIVAMLFATILGILMGVLASLNYNTILDRFLVSFSVLGVSVPSYFSALLLALFLGYYFADYTGLNLTGSLIAISDEGEYYFEWKNIILPAIALGIRPIAIVTQLTRNAMLDVIRSDYVRTAKAKGLSSFQVIFKHTLRNALNPVITSVSDWFATLLAGAFFVEWIFDYKGLGHTTVSALLNFDFPVVMGAILFIAFVFVILSIVVDIFYSLVDPRVRLE